MIQLNLDDIEAVLDRANDDADRVSVYEYREALNAVYRTAMRILSEKMTVERERDRAQAQLENVLDASKEGAWMARALDAERERDELKAEVERERRANADFEWQVERIEDGVRGVGMFLRRTDGGDSKAPSGEARNLYLNYGDAAKERDIAIRERDELKTRLAHAEADAEQAAHNEAFNERMKIVAWMRNRVIHKTTASMQTLDELVSICDAIHRGEHE